MTVNAGEIPSRSAYNAADTKLSLDVYGEGGRGARRRMGSSRELFAAALLLSADARESFGTAQSAERRVRCCSRPRRRPGRRVLQRRSLMPLAQSSRQAFAHFEIVRLLGRGGMGEVYLAVDLSLGRQVALKLLPTAFQHDPERLRRFIREARAAATLNHPHIVTVYEVGESNGQPFIATEFVEGENLADVLVRGSMALSEGIRIGRQIVNALAAAHAAGIVHRDLKPANIMVRADGVVKLVDFGLAHLVSGSAVKVTCTSTGQILGTPAYMAPEQQAGQPVDARTDIYAFGCVLYEMTSGARPERAAAAPSSFSRAHRQRVPAAGPGAAMAIGG